VLTICNAATWNGVLPVEVGDIALSLDFSLMFCAENAKKLTKMGRNRARREPLKAAAF
jgi:hypothetical protein